MKEEGGGNGQEELDRVKNKIEEKLANDDDYYNTFVNQNK